MAIKPGKSTSEFGLALFAMIISAAIMIMEFAGIGEGHMAVKLAVMAKTWLLASGYGWQRMKAKRDSAIMETEMAKINAAPSNENAELATPAVAANPS